MPVYAGYFTSIANLLTAGRFETVSLYVGERTPFDRTKYSVALATSNSRDVKRPLSFSRDIGRCVHCCPESVRNSSSALSDANPESDAPTSTDAPFGTAALPGTTRTIITGVAASAVPHGTNSARAVSRR